MLPKRPIVPLNDAQLRWVSQNRGRRSRCEPLAEVVAKLPMARWKRAATRWGRIVGILRDELGAECLARLSIRGLRSGVLALEMDDASEACLYEYQYAARLVDSLHRHCPAAGIVRVRFLARRERQQID